MKEEQVLYKQYEYEVVLVGSSISAKLVELPEGWFNLAMGAQSSISGLRTLCESQITPCIVVIETNNLNLGRESNQNFLTDQLKHTHPAFLTENKPSHVALRALAKLAGLKAGSQRVPTNLVLSEPDRVTVSQELFKKMLDRRKAACKVAMDPSEFNKRIEQVKTSVDELEARGFKVLFVEVPECLQTYESLRKTQIRAGYQSSFSIDRYDWFNELENIHFYASNDAIHLTANSAKRFSMALVERVGQLKHVTK